MRRSVVARLLRLLLAACWTAAVFGVVVIVPDHVVGEGQRVLLPFVAAALAAAGLVAARKPVDR